MTRRLLGLALLLIALAGAVWAGTIVRHHLDGPGPIATVRTATEAYAHGDCEALRDVSAKPKAIECATVHEIEQAYRDEGLKPAEFTYRVAQESDDSALVRVSYMKDGNRLNELIPVEKDHGDWKVSEVGGHVD